MIEWKNRYSALSPLVEVKENLYEKAVVQLDKIKTENENLKKRIEETKREVTFYASSTFKYKTKLDSVLSVPAKKDTIYFGDPTVELDSTDRIFKAEVKDEIKVEGYFQTKEPYMLSIKDLEYLFALDIALSEDKDRNFYFNIDTKSSKLKPENVNVYVKNRHVPINLIGSIGILGNKDKIFNGIEIHGGIEKGGYGGYLGVQTIFDEIIYKIGLIKRLEL